MPPGKPSHRITFTPVQGEPWVWRVRLVRDGEHDHYRADCAQHHMWWWTWTRDRQTLGPSQRDLTNGWCCSGGPTPDFRSGTVEVEPLVPGWEPTRAKWTYNQHTGELLCLLTGAKRQETTGG